MPDVTHCSTLYHHLFGMGNIFKYFLINHVPAIGFASRLCRLIPDSRHDSWHERLENHCPSFSLVSITLVSGCKEKRRRRSWYQDLTQDILPRLVRVTDRSETCWHAGQPLSRAERWLDDEEARRERRAHNTPVGGKSNPDSFIMLSVYLNGYVLCYGLRRQTDTPCIVW